MINFALAMSVLLTLFVLLSLSVLAGRAYGRRQIAHHAENQLEVVIVAEGAVFTLLALLVAFCFSGAYDRFETRKLHIIEEANTIDTAYKRIGLLAPAAQEGLRQSFRDYVDAQLKMYKDTIKFKLFDKEFATSHAIQEQIWTQTLAALKITNDPSAEQLFVPALNDMFDAENGGVEISRVHPPLAIFGLLIGLAILSGFLAGYSTAEKKSKNSLHILSYVAITAFTIYIIIDLELPRVGLIRIDSFDRFLVDVRDSMK
jgi:hypothetical protein